MSALAIVIAGVKGRMGRQIAALALADEEAFDVIGGTGSEAGPGITITDDQGTAHSVAVSGVLGEFTRKPAVVIDFTAPSATFSMLNYCVDHGIAMVIGTTGFAAHEEEAIEKAAEKIAIVKAGNMSLGVNLLSVLIEQAAAALGPDYDIEIHEAHHRHKKDAPSGTALMLGEAAAKGRGVALDDVAVHGREGLTGARAPGAIGFSVTRAGGIIGEHEVSFGAAEEVVTLSHKALDRAVFARGALTAASWLAGTGAPKSPGLYSMRDVLGLSA